jgi:hypothetical protein
MVRVVNEKKYLYVRCTGCFKLLEYSEEDLRTGPLVPELYVNCPVPSCHEVIDMTYEVPGYIRRKLCKKR